MNTSTCKWANDTTISIENRQNELNEDNIWLFQPSDNITVLSNVISIKCGGHCVEKSVGKYPLRGFNITVQYPAYPTRPVVVLIAPKVIGINTGGLQLDLSASASSGSGGKMWQIPVFTVSHPDSSIGMTLQHRLNEYYYIGASIRANYTTVNLITIPDSYLGYSDESYLILVKLCNYLHSC